MEKKRTHGTYAVSGILFKNVTLDDNFVRHEKDYRPCGDMSLARAELGWIPETGFRDLVRMMVLAALESP